MKTGELIRKYRLEKGMKQVQLADKTGIHVSTIRQYELGIRNPKTERLKIIADALEVPFSCLLGFNPEKYRKKTLADFTTEEIFSEMKRRIANDNGKNSLKQKNKKDELMIE